MYSCMCSNVLPVMLFIIPLDFNNVLSLIWLRIMRHLFLFKKLIKRLSFVSLRWADSLIIDVTLTKKNPFYVGWPYITTPCLSFHFLHDIVYFSSMEKEQYNEVGSKMLLLMSCKVMMGNYYVKAKVSIIWSWNWGFHCISEKKIGAGYCLHLSPPTQIISNGAWVIHGCVPVRGLVLQSGEACAKPETCRVYWGFAFVTLCARSDLELHCGAFPIVFQTYILLALSSCYSLLC